MPLSARSLLALLPLLQGCADPSAPGAASRVEVSSVASVDSFSPGRAADPPLGPGASLASAPSIASAAAPSPPPVPRDWTRYSHASAGFSLWYPSKIFPSRKEDAAGVTLASALRRETLGGDPRPAMWTYAVRVRLEPAPPRSVFSRHYPSFFQEAFPGGASGPLAAGQGTDLLQVAGREGLRVRGMGVEGYNTEVVYVPWASGATLVLRLDFIGEVMRPEIPVERQLEIFEAVLGGVSAP